MNQLNPDPQGGEGNVDDDTSRLITLCNETQACDDALGKYSDYEGNEDGPTFHLWQNGKNSFDRHCDMAIQDHKRAIAVWRKLKKLNGERDEN